MGATSWKTSLHNWLEPNKLCNVGDWIKSDRYYYCSIISSLKLALLINITKLNKSPGKQSKCIKSLVHITRMLYMTKLKLNVIYYLVLSNKNGTDYYPSSCDLYQHLPESFKVFRSKIWLSEDNQIFVTSSTMLKYIYYRRMQGKKNIVISLEMYL